MKKLLCTLCMVIGIVTMALTAGGVSAQHYVLGDLGKPHDYDQTIRYLRDTVEDFESFVDQLPAEFNWKTQVKVIPAKDQQDCGSCWAFASVGAIESKLLINGKPTYDLSEQQQVSCNMGMAACSGGQHVCAQILGNGWPHGGELYGLPFLQRLRASVFDS